MSLQGSICLLLLRALRIQPNRPCFHICRRPEIRSPAFDYFLPSCLRAFAIWRVYACWFQRTSTRSSCAAFAFIVPGSRPRKRFLMSSCIESQPVRLAGASREGVSEPLQTHHPTLAFEKCRSEMLAWFGKSVGVRLDALLRCVPFSHHTVGPHDAFDELGT